ncbi:pyrimidine/purine nucleoside phosphorylase [Mucilaginibacter aquaedulcis]|uniref:pyrimidine/purine nucleoside phosphorylase n=1 Tax=Mucilaginibacter aquaedulcis TaxID=1187081 RepID=UPI0025B46020|nr:pyrimidine/purine nucleoside phosphorylase [Mucilaginibacter aquaedulcis]MDN3547093.1 pyrimidine/purine nucleoside phosphorylase [Mucilaginibacter aquaedulcis]
MINVNEYFEGAVKSLAYDTAQGRSTIGVIEKGEYEFGTSSHETMTVIEGRLEALLPGQQDWQVFTNGQSFEVPANASFKVKTSVQSSYLCTYR